MSIKTIRHRLLYLKDGLQGTIYAALSNTRWLAALTPVLAFLIRPLLGLTLTTLALLQSWTFYNTLHKNVDGWLITLSSLTGSVFNNIAAFGGFIARLQGFSFALAPWFFMAGFTVGAITQLSMAIINARRAYESPAHSAQRQHHAQAAVFNLLTATQLASCVSAIFLFNVFPAYSLLVTGFALTVVTINVTNSIWRSLSSDTKKKIKKEFGFIKPEDKPVVDLNKSVIAEGEPLHCSRLFTTCDHRRAIQGKSVQASKKYLHACITKKLDVLTKGTQNQKSGHKIKVLELLEQVLTGKEHLLDKGKLHQQYPRVVDNFWCEKSETDQLIDAVNDYVHLIHEEQNGHLKRSLTR
jgi:hypothetical protein